MKLVDVYVDWIGRVLKGPGRDTFQATNWMYLQAWGKKLDILSEVGRPWPEIQSRYHRSTKQIARRRLVLRVIIGFCI
jgi:hypothetical protein